MSAFSKFFGGSDPLADYETPEEAVIKPDLVYEILGPWRRRWVIDYLSTVEADEISTKAVSIKLAEQEVERNCPVSRPMYSDDKKRVYISLYQTHMPKLAEWGVIEWVNEPAGILRPTELCHHLADCMEYGIDRVNGGRSV